MNNFFSIVIDTCNHEQWIEKCLKTCLTQRYDNYEVILVDALSDDKTYEIAQKYATEFKRLKVFQNTKRLPQIANFFWLRELSTIDSIMVSVDGDDCLRGCNVLSKLNEVYNSGDVWLSYGTYAEFHGEGLPFRSVSHIYRKYPDEVINNNSFREYQWLGSHLRTFRKNLFDKVNPDDCKKEDGQWLDTCGDIGIMFSMLEMAGNRSRYIPDILYEYNVANTSRDGALNEKRQMELANYVRSKKKYQKIETL